MGRRSTRRHAHNNKNMKQGKFRCQFIWNVFNNDWLPAEGCDAVTANIEYPVFYQLPYRVLSRQKNIYIQQMNVGENEAQTKPKLLRVEQWILSLCEPFWLTRKPDSGGPWPKQKSTFACEWHGPRFAFDGRH